jgi:two-component system NtrC family sensor kinase
MQPSQGPNLISRLSVRGVLIGVMLLVAAAAIGIVAAVGVISIDNNIVREAQERVNHDLDTTISLYEAQFRNLTQQFEGRVGTLTPDEASPELAPRLSEWRRQLGFTVLNLCDPEGRPIAGAYPDREASVPISEDPVLRRALGGELARGTVLLEPQRLALEGGLALRNLVAVEPDAASGTSSALFFWFARPVTDVEGRVVALVYGGRTLNHNYALVDSFRTTLFTAEVHEGEGKPLGTVTVFLGTVRVATNVLRPDGRRAVGTEVSSEVAHQVLERGRRWQGRAWVVDAWYLSGYEPLLDPDGRRVGMLYVGLLEAPYAEIRSRLIVGFLSPVIVVLVLGLLVVALIVRQIVRPLDHLRERAERIADGEWEGEVNPERTYREISDLAESFRKMQSAVRERDGRLRDQNRTLAGTNDQLERVNSNYMQTLGFVTHELKSPLAAIQGHIDLLVDGLVCDLPGEATPLPVRIKRNCEELQDMVKNYLDLSRVERGELAADRRAIDLVTDVVRPSLDQNEPLFESRRMRLETDLPETLPLTADPELLRIALTNYLSNAAKYGAEGGLVRLEVCDDDQVVTVKVWNEGSGFTGEESTKLFQKFSRLRNPNTTNKRGSGLGLWLCQMVVGLHGGSVSAESEPGQWARFTFRVPQEG